MAIWNGRDIWNSVCDPVPHSTLRAELGTCAVALSGGSGLCSVIPRGGPRLTDGVRDPPYLPTPDTCCHLEIIILFWRGSKKFSRRIAFNQHALRPPLSPLLSAPTSHYKSMKSQIKDHEKLASPQGRDILPPPPKSCVWSAGMSVSLFSVYASPRMPGTASTWWLVPPGGTGPSTLLSGSRRPDP